MDGDYYIKLIYKAIKNEISSDELKQLDKWTNESNANLELREEIELSWQLSSSSDDAFEIDVEGDLRKVKLKLESPKVLAPQTKPKVRSLLSRRLAIAASFLFLACASYFLLFQNDSNTTQVIASQSQSKVIDLEDGSKVWLNKNSEIEISASFGESDRSLRLKGEAFFEVSRNENLPFEIKTSKSTVTVLGTSFNVKELKNQLSVIVRSGKVKLSDSVNEVILEKNEIGVHDYTSSKVFKESVRSNNAESWRTNKVKFVKQKLRDVLTELEALYNVSFEVASPAVLDCDITLLINSTEFSKVLEDICDTLSMESEKTNPNTIRLINGSCQ